MLTEIIDDSKKYMFDNQCRTAIHVLCQHNLKVSHNAELDQNYESQ